MFLWFLVATRIANAVLLGNQVNPSEVNPHLSHLVELSRKSSVRFVVHENFEFCSGTLVSSSGHYGIVSAAHCFTEKSLENLEIRIFMGSGLNFIKTRFSDLKFDYAPGSGRTKYQPEDDLVMVKIGGLKPIGDAVAIDLSLGLVGILPISWAVSGGGLILARSAVLIREEIDTGKSEMTTNGNIKVTRTSVTASLIRDGLPSDTLRPLTAIYNRDEVNFSDSDYEKRPLQRRPKFLISDVKGRICSGDSGGGLIALGKNHQPVLAGVAHTVINRWTPSKFKGVDGAIFNACNERDAFVDVQAHRTWLLNALSN